MTIDEGRAGVRNDELDFDEDYQEKPVWPKVIGIISIIFGALGVICGGLSLASMFVMPGMMASANFEGGTPPVFPYAPPPISLTILAVAGVLWAIVLLGAGIMTASRKPAGRPAHLIWAVGTILLSLPSFYMQIQMQNEVARWMRDNPDAMLAQQGSAGSVIGMAVGALMTFSWPLFVIIWFGAVKRRNEDLAVGVEDLAA